MNRGYSGDNSDNNIQLWDTTYRHSLQDNSGVFWVQSLYYGFETIFWTCVALLHFVTYVHDLPPVIACVLLTRCPRWNKQYKFINRKNIHYEGTTLYYVVCLDTVLNRQQSNTYFTEYLHCVDVSLQLSKYFAISCIGSQTFQIALLCQNN